MKRFDDNLPILLGIVCFTTTMMLVISLIFITYLDKSPEFSLEVYTPADIWFVEGTGDSFIVFNESGTYRVKYYTFEEVSGFLSLRTATEADYIHNTVLRDIMANATITNIDSILSISLLNESYVGKDAYLNFKYVPCSEDKELFCRENY